MIMPRGHQLLLPANPMFMLFSLACALLLDMLQSMLWFGNAAWSPDWLALVLVFWAIHQPLKVGVGIAFFDACGVDFVSHKLHKFSQIVHKL
jgi:rod shape-determining protein MreD